MVAENGDISNSDLLGYFSAGPAKLPDEVLKIAQEEFTNYNNCKVGVMELSHRLVQPFLVSPCHFRHVFFKKMASFRRRKTHSSSRIYKYSHFSNCTQYFIASIFVPNFLLHSFQ